MTDPGVPSPALVTLLRRGMLPVVRLAHRPTLEGLASLPESGPYLLVANHSGGLGLAEIHCFASIWADTFRGERPLAGFAHPFGFHVWPLSRLLPGVGAIPSSYAAAEATLARGVPILVFPGGDHEVIRPIWQANCVDFGGRVGFLRIAHRAWIPIVPMGIRGSHYTVPVLARSKLLAFLAVWPRLVGIKRWPVTLLGLAGAVAIALLVPAAWPWRLFLAWAWCASPFMLMPFVPWTIRIRIGEPIAPEVLFPARGHVDDATLARALAVVERAVGERVTGRRAPPV